MPEAFDPCVKIEKPEGKAGGAARKRSARATSAA
jgi:hypothetical protein